MRISHTVFISSLLAVTLLANGCKPEEKEGPSTTPVPPVSTDTPVKGFGLMARICGIWNGPVHSSTMLGSYPEWIVDFRPISPSQVSAKNELDTLNDIYMSFFVVYHNGEYKLAFRNGGSFNGSKRTSYMAADSVSENGTEAYYRFSDFVKGPSKTVTEVIFKPDSLILRSYTNRYNTISEPLLHMEWKARLQDQSAGADAVSNFNFPQKSPAKNFSTTFSQVSESVYYQLQGDPYPEDAQPYLGKAELSWSAIPSLTVNTSGKVFLIVTTEPLFSGLFFQQQNLKYRSRYVILSATSYSYLFNYMHPGAYYLYALYDSDGSQGPSSGDYISTSNTAFSLSAQGETSAHAQLNFLVP